MKRVTLVHISALLVVLLAYQACGKRVDFKSHEKASSSTDNGEGYAGKLTSYEFRDPAQACVQLDKNNRPLPNGQIFSFENGGLQLVRKLCADITPQNLNPQDVVVQPNGDFQFQNQNFAALALQDFGVVAANCPVPRAPAASPVRVSLLPPVLNLTAAGWGTHDSVTASYMGSLSSLPLFNVERTNPSALDNWRRLSASANLVNSEMYVFSFFAKRSVSGERALFIGSHANISLMDVEVAFNLDTGAASVLVASGVTNFSTTSVVVGDGLYFSVYFQPSTASTFNFGVAPESATLGARIAMTAMSLERVSAFCAP